MFNSDPSHRKNFNRNKQETSEVSFKIDPLKPGYSKLGNFPIVYLIHRKVD